MDRDRDRDRLLTPTFLIVTAATFAYFMAVGVMIPALPHFIEGPVGGGSVAVGLGVGMFSVAAVITRPFVGGIGDRRGRRLLMLVGPVVVAAAVSLFVFAQHSLALLVGLRAVQGIGEAGFYVGAATLITDLAPPHRRGEAVSYFSVALYLGLAVGPSLSEAVLQHTHYTRVWVLACLFALAASGLSLAVREVRVLPSSDEPTSSTRVVHPAALIPGSVLGLGILAYAAFSAFVPLYAPKIGASGSGPAFVVYAGVTLAVRIFGARIPDTLGPVRCATFGTAAVAVGMAIIGAVPSTVGLYGGTAVFSIGVSLNFPALLSLAVAGAPDSERGSVVGTFTAFFDLGQGVGAFALGGIAALTSERGTFDAACVTAIAGVVLLQMWARRNPERVAASQAAHLQLGLEP